MATKTSCPIDRDTFANEAGPVKVTIGATTFEVDPKEFSTGSLGWYLSGKVTLEVGGVRCPVQVGLNLTLVGSKDLPQ